MSTLRLVASVTALVALAACDRATTEPSLLAPNAVSASRGADDAAQQQKQQPQPGDARGKGADAAPHASKGANPGEAQPNDDHGQHAQPNDDKGAMNRRRDDPKNHH